MWVQCAHMYYDVEEFEEMNKECSRDNHKEASVLARAEDGNWELLC